MGALLGGTPRTTSPRAAQSAPAAPGPVLRGRLPYSPSEALSVAPQDCVNWPLPENLEINARKQAIGQGEGMFGTFRQGRNGRPAHHQGVDITAPRRTAVIAAQGGLVARVDTTDRN